MLVVCCLLLGVCCLLCVVCRVLGVCYRFFVICDVCAGFICCSLFAVGRLLFDAVFCLLLLLLRVACFVWCSLLVVGCWLLAVGCWLLVVGCCVCVVCLM